MIITASGMVHTLENRLNYRNNMLLLRITSTVACLKETEMLRDHNYSLSVWSILLTLTLFLSGCGYNSIQTMDENVTASWSEVINQYQRRADLVPNLVNTVKGYAQHEEEVLTEVTAARAKVGQLPPPAASPDNEQMMKQYQAAQGELSSALSRLLVVTENYPELKANTLFQDLMTQLEGTENRITVARGRYVKAVQDYNTYIRQFPAVITAKVMGYSPKTNFTVENEKAISVSPTVDFNTSPPAKSAN